ncbi:MAG TPA: hypothetical protein EYQ20_13865 [candidate division Zixibacteria bacterium]|nr:hypothetical protein [candidate division Zixibacteria bacterium]
MGNGMHSETPWRSSIMLGLCFFLSLCIFRYEVLFFPPYWDSITGLFSEAVWLDDHRFDYYKLMYETPGYNLGGARDRLFSFYPTLQALLIRLIPDTSLLLLINHLLSFGYASVALLAFYHLLRYQFTKDISLLGCFLLLGFPLFITQADALYMEMPLLAFSLSALACTIYRRPVLGACLAMLAMYTKPTGIICVATLFVFNLIDLTVTRRQRRAACGILGICVLLFIMQWFLYQTFYQEIDDAFRFMRGALKGFFQSMPDFLMLYLIFGLFTGLTLKRHLQEASFTIKPFFITLFKDRLNILMIVFLSWFTLFYMNIIIILPRYFLLCLPVLLFGLISLMVRYLKRAWLIRSGILILTGLFLYNLSGRLYSVYPKNDGFILERSLEYMDDMRLNIQLAKRLEEKYADTTIITSWPYIQMLVLPQLGYVTKPLNAVTINGPLSYGPFTKAAATKDTVWVYGPNCFSGMYGYYPHEDELIETISKGERQVVIFRNIE